eukprot:6190517-Pleurochrysis_carterae.AAC.1
MLLRAPILSTAGEVRGVGRSDTGDSTAWRKTVCLPSSTRMGWPCRWATRSASCSSNERTVVFRLMRANWEHEERKPHSKACPRAEPHALAQTSCTAGRMSHPKMKH